MKSTIAIDLGGTVIKIGLLHNEKIVECVHLESQLSLGLKANLPRIKEVIDRMMRQAHQIHGIGLAFPGLVDPKKGKVISTNEKYNDACGYDIKGWFIEKWGVPFYMDNDARLATVGEWCQGAAKGRDNVVMMTLGTGIGTGVIIDGRVLYGQHYQAGSLGGHFVVDYKGAVCSCGNRGCVEALASSFFLPNIVRQHPGLSESFKEKADTIDFKAVFQLAEMGDVDARIIRDECMDIWSAAITTYIHAYDPEVVVLGGGIMHSAEVIVPYVQERVDRYTWCPSGKVPIVVARLSESAALQGLDYCLTQKIRKESIYDKSVI